MTKRNPEFGGFSACFAVRAETDQKGKATPPARTETIFNYVGGPTFLISTHSAREDGDFIAIQIQFIVVISTHSAREDGDLADMKKAAKNVNFNPLRPQGRRRYVVGLGCKAAKFQPTPPARTETLWALTRKEDLRYFNPLRPRGRRHCRRVYQPL